MCYIKNLVLNESDLWLFYSFTLTKGKVCITMINENKRLCNSIKK